MPITALKKEQVKDQQTINRIRARTEKLRRKYSRRAIQNMMYLSPTEYLQKNEILNSDGTPYEFPDDEVLFGDDPDFRWLDNCFLARDKSGNYRFHRFRNLDRLIVLDILLKIEFAEYR
jgi:hypothetical protein